MSLRARLLIGTALIALVLAVACVAVVRITRADLIDQVDAQLAGARPQLPMGRGGDPSGAGPRLSNLYVGFLTDDGELVTISEPDLTGDAAPVPVLDEEAAAAVEAGDTITVPSDGSDVDYRITGRARGRPGGTTVVALPLDDVQETIRRLVVVLGGAAVAVLAVLGLVTWWVMRLGVRPLRRMAQTAGEIAEGDLSARVPVAAEGTEAGTLGRALNRMMARIEEAFGVQAASEARLRRFVGDASHELRTPVATIRGYAELYRVGGLRAPSELDDAMHRTEQEAIRMGGLVDDLLHLARLDQGRPLDRRPVDLGALVDDALRDARVVAADRRIERSGDPSLVVEGDDGRLRQVVTNLVTNALVHAPGSTVHVDLAARDGAAVLTVRDDGPGMPEEDAAHAFERFYRADAARGRDTGGSGLGLAIVQATVEAHGGRVELDARPGQGVTVRVELPLAADQVPTSSAPEPLQT